MNNTTQTAQPQDPGLVEMAMSEALGIDPSKEALAANQRKQENARRLARLEDEQVIQAIKLSLLDQGLKQSDDKFFSLDMKHNDGAGVGLFDIPETEPVEQKHNFYR